LLYISNWKNKSNIEVARRANKFGIKTVAITLYENSQLARQCSEVIPLKITKVITPTAGFSTFTANVVTCFQISGVTLPDKYHYWYDKAVKFSLNELKSVGVSNDLTHVLANNLLYPIALYTSFQMAEFFGNGVVAQKLEEFCHSPIFGTKKSDVIWIFGQNEKRTSQILKRLGVRTQYIEFYNRSVLNQLFQSIFLVRSLMLLLAEKHGIKELKYLTLKNFLRTSSDIIYR